MKRIFVAALFLAAVVLGGCGQNACQPVLYRDTDIAMGTVIQQNIYVRNDAEDGGTVTEEILGLIRRMEQETLSRRLETAEIYLINRRREGEAHLQISEELGEILMECQDVWEASQGAFDVTLAPVIRLWDIDKWSEGAQEGTFAVPERQEILQALENCRSGEIRLAKQENGYEMELPAGTELDLGAVGKGAALDEIRRVLEQREEISGGVISVGGSILVYGAKPDGSSWKVAIVNPADTASAIGYMSLKGTWCVSTSGDYERYAMVDGIRYHHILNPATGYPADSGVRSVTVLSDSGLLSDALSTACFVLGIEEGMELAEKYGAEALFVDTKGNIVMSPGMEECFTSAK